MTHWLESNVKPSPGKKVLATYVNESGKRRRIIAEYVPRFHRVGGPECDLACEYRESDDQYYWPEGWYECIDNWGDFSHIAVTEGDVSHWAPLLPPPEQP